MPESIAELEAEVTRLGQEIDRLLAERKRMLGGMRSTLSLVREAGDCLLMMAPGEAKDRIWKASLTLFDLCGGPDASH